MSNTILQDLLDDVSEIQDTYMLKRDYDANEDGIVDETESVDGGTFEE